jgi:hypothetical protein
MTNEVLAEFMEGVERREEAETLAWEQSLLWSIELLRIARIAQEGPEIS